LLKTVLVIDGKHGHHPLLLEYGNIEDRHKEK